MRPAEPACVVPLRSSAALASLLFPIECGAERVANFLCRHRPLPDLIVRFARMWRLSVVVLRLRSKALSLRLEVREGIELRFIGLQHPLFTFQHLAGNCDLYHFILRFAHKSLIHTRTI